MTAVSHALFHLLDEFPELLILVRILEMASIGVPQNGRTVLRSRSQYKPVP